MVPIQRSSVDSHHSNATSSGYVLRRLGCRDKVVVDADIHKVHLHASQKRAQPRPEYALIQTTETDSKSATSHTNTTAAVAV